ncbi:hypothetical protein OF83DRAFT_1176920 [Amylostereum chailletii]|nr:hypothetical protein OF83DRAFT_1176920 [Amylostereum chailletii]
MAAQALIVPTLGAMLIGALISVAMYGLATGQVLFYFQGRGGSDKPLIKLFVGALRLVLETIHTFLVGTFLFKSLIRDDGNFVAILVTRASDDLTTGFTALIIFSVHLFYAHRLWILGDKNAILISVVVILAVLDFGFEMAIMILTLKHRAFSGFHAQDAVLSPYFVAALTLALATDIVIAVWMSIVMNRKRSGYRGTDTLINKIILYTIATGAVTSVFDVIILICNLAIPDSLAYLAIFAFIPNLYASSLLVMLNARNFFNHRPGHLNNIAATSLALTDFPTASASSPTKSHEAASKLVFAQSREQVSIMNVSSKGRDV